MITRESEPPNLEMPFGTLDGFITPTERFYVRCHFAIPQIDGQSWRLSVEGAVERQVQISLDELRQLPVETITATLECAGNGRVFLVPKVKGVQWELGAVGNAEWTGIRLRHVLERAGLTDAAAEVVLEGADKGTIAEPPRPGGAIHFARSIPMAKAMNDVLLAWEMNGRPLTAAHGFPLRAVVPGWYGMASVKWLQRIIIIDQPFNGYYQTVDYGFWQRGGSGPVLAPLTEMQAKAQIAQPENHAAISANGNCVVKGAAWSGEGAITKVELSVDDGNSWRAVTLEGDPKVNAWRLWRFEWINPKRGKRRLLARATDSRGRVQPLERNADGGTYMIDHCLPIEIEVL
ncbi:MAG: sulfite oxidase [Chthoniobacterales bacterium]|nr:MAG: sulfite oxidase [Chthoniobacterales bacterium]